MFIRSTPCADSRGEIPEHKFNTSSVKVVSWPLFDGIGPVFARLEKRASFHIMKKRVIQRRYTVLTCRNYRSKALILEGE